MSNELKITKGEWKVLRECQIIVDSEGCGIAQENGVSNSKDWEANAQLIAEAGTVANETGKTPRQLAQENKMLLEALKDVADYFFLEKNLDDEEYIDMEQKAFDAIANATKKR